MYLDIYLIIVFVFIFIVLILNIKPNSKLYEGFDNIDVITESINNSKSNLNINENRVNLEDMIIKYEEALNYKALEQIKNISGNNKLMFSDKEIDDINKIYSLIENLNTSMKFLDSQSN